MSYDSRIRLSTALIAVLLALFMAASMSACGTLLNPLKDFAAAQDTLSAKEYVGLSAKTIRIFTRLTVRLKRQGVISDRIKHLMLDHLQTAQDSAVLARNAIVAQQAIAVEDHARDIRAHLELARDFLRANGLLRHPDEPLIQ